MPIYEYWCGKCRKKVEILFLRLTDSTHPRCPRCGDEDLRRLLSRFSPLKSEDARLESLADPSHLSGLDEKDPASMARWLKRMGREMGEDVGSDEIDQMADEIASGRGLGDEATGETGDGFDGGAGSGEPL